MGWGEIRYARRYPLWQMLTASDGFCIQVSLVVGLIVEYF